MSYNWHIEFNMVENMMKQLKAVDFFCGGGGMSYGLQKAGIRILAGIDYEINCKETYETNIKGASFIHANVFELTEKELEKTLDISRKDDNLILVGCSPCQYWSVIRTSKEKSEKSKSLLSEFQRFVEYFVPGYVVVENVPGIFTRQEESGLDIFVRRLEELGYTVHFGIHNTKNYGVPQSRKRFTLIANRVTQDKLEPLELKDKVLTVRDVLGEKNGFPKIPAGHQDVSEYLHSCAGLSEINIRRLRLVPKDGGTRLAFADRPDLQLKCFIGKDNYFKDTFGRLWWDQPSPTITTKFFSISNGRFAHPEEDRALSLREGATLQSFPKDYVFKAKGREAIARLIGNAVPPKYAEQIGKAIISNLK
ncbi:DNA cytosine methyltransferase [Actinobacillus pleuropneumoniae]|uniref:DNA (cytosine-5-)-methyltransferase n=2 Tax=Actinobacillus pleuropneumoniae TaxID=715 RepID=A3N1K4_ACTP2|nr:DNA cytosine methyltransferase [Actinobacillus pleuropneumoniae]ABN74290.1 modification methylase [Actinobacillus pleuropneumoniae serovar 5b str. L20]